MPGTLIEFRIETDIERSDELAVVLLVNIYERDGGVGADYRLWRGTLFGPTTGELWEQRATELDSDLALTLLKELGSAKVAPCPKFNVWLHPTVYHLKVDSVFVTAQYTWHEELPDQWQQLSPVVSLLKRIVDEAKDEA